MSRIFISYRRDDGASYAERLYDSLAGAFGPEQVLMDVSSLEHGADFVGRIKAAVGSADALLVVIGRDWLDARNLEGERRLDNPDDFVRLEVGTALRGDRLVIPVLVDGATLPAEDELPPDLAPLARRHALTLTDAEWRSGVAELVAALERVTIPVAEPTTARPPPASVPSPRQPVRWWHRLTRRSEGTQRSDKPRGPSAGELAEKRALGPAEPVGAPSDVAAGDGGDIVDCTVFAPAFATPGDTVFVQVFAHLVEQAEEARGLAEAFDAEAEHRAFKTLEAIVRRGSSLMFDLRVGLLPVVDHVQSLVWRGRPTSVQFDVDVPQGARAGAYVGTLTVSLDSVPIGHVKFKLAVRPRRRYGEPRSEPVGDEASRYRSAFVSYSSEDRQAVLERVQMLKPLGIEYFQDLLDLDPGDRWKQELYRSIDRSDLFLLFWSSHAKASRWVRNEVQYALERKGDDDFAPPEIHPVIIEGPPIPSPWPELAHMHFGDRLVYFMTGGSRPEA